MTDNKDPNKVMPNPVGLFGRKTQNQRMAYADPRVIETERVTECFLPLNNDNRNIAQLLAGKGGAIKEVPQQGFIFVEVDPALVTRLQATGKLDAEQTATASMGHTHSYDRS